MFVSWTVNIDWGDSGGRTRAYAYEEHPKMKILAQTIEDGDEALLKNMTINGVKGPCA